MLLLRSTSRLYTRWGNWLAFLLCLCVLASTANRCHAIGSDDVVERPTLIWRNGDLLEGELHSATSSVIRWQTDTFIDPLQLNLESLQSIRFATKRDEVAQEPDDRKYQIIETHDGNRFFGQITSSDDSTVTTRTEMFGDIVLKRSAIHLIANPLERAHVYSGPKGLRGWGTLTYGRRLTEWDEIAAGQLKTTMVAAELYRTLPAKGSVDIDIEVLWRNNPSFQLRFLTPFATPTKETIKVETRVNGYILQSLGSNGRFRQLDVISKEATKCRLLLRWNHTARDLSVYRDRRYLGKVHVDQGKGGGNAGFYLKNTGPQLTLSRLEVRASSSLDIRYADPSKDTILLGSNNTIEGDVQNIDADGITANASGEEEKVPWDRIAEIFFRADTKSDATPEQAPEQDDAVECIFANGETLKGTLLGADAFSLSLQIPAVERPVQCKLNKIERLLLGRPSVPPPTGSQYLQLKDRKLHGQFAATESGQLGWLPTGGVQAAALNLEADTELRLSELNSSSAGGPQDDLVYLRNGDVIPCRVQHAGQESLKIKCPLASDNELSSADMLAVEFSVDAIEPLIGFDDRWQIELAEEKAKRNAITQTQHQVHFTAPGTVSRQSILYGCDQISFDLKKRVAEGGIFLHFVLKGENGTEDRAIPFYFMDDKLFVLGSKRNAFIPCDNEKGLYKVSVETHDPFELIVNDKTVYTVPRDQNGGPWSGLSFDVSDGPLFGPPLRKKRKEIDITVDSLVIRQTKRASIRQAVGGVDAAPLLTVPRNRTDASLKHVAVGINGDVVRGELAQLSEDYLTLTSKGSELPLSREKLSGLIWLHPSKTTETPPNENDAKTNPADKPRAQTRVILKDTTTVTLTDLSVTAGEIRGQHPSLGQCAVPLQNVRGLLLGNATNELHQYDFLKWRTKPAIEPMFATDGSDGHQLKSALAGKSLRFEAELLETRERLDLSAYRGKVVILDFWASWCAPCMRNMNALIETVAKHPDDKVQLIAVNQGEDPALVLATVESRQWDLLVATDVDGTATQELKIEALPQTVVLDRNGKVSAVYLGASRQLHAELAKQIEKLLGETP